MLNFIVLGLVPGTDLQIGFNFFMSILSAIACVYLVKLLLKEIHSDTHHTSENETSKEQVTQ